MSSEKIIAGAIMAENLVSPLYSSLYILRIRSAEEECAGKVRHLW